MGYMVQETIWFDLFHNNENKIKRNYIVAKQADERV